MTDAVGRSRRRWAARRPRRPVLRLPLALVALLALVLGVGACSPSGSAPSVPSDADAVLGVGREVWMNECARCHGAAGRGGAGPRLAGRVVERFPDPAAEAELVAEGRQGMPGFGSSLSPEDIEAVVRYTRELL